MKEPSIESIAQLVSIKLYSRRFFPFYAYNILVGLDSASKDIHWF